MEGINKNRNILVADYANPQHAEDIVYLLNQYALHPMGGGKPLDSAVVQNLVSELAKRSYAFSVLCYVNEAPAGLGNCMESFSSFKCKPIVNIHDLYVDGKYRGLGLSHALMDKVEQIAREKRSGKITLEVLEGNQVAQASYRKFGFAGYELDPEMGRAMFWEKQLTYI